MCGISKLKYIFTVDVFKKPTPPTKTLVELDADYWDGRRTVLCFMRLIRRFQERCTKAKY